MPAINATSANATFTEDTNPNSVAGAGIRVFTGVNVADPDGIIESATVAISANFVVGDVLTVNAFGGFSVNYDENAGVLTITGSGTPAQYGAMLSTLRYGHDGDNPTLFGAALDRTITLSVFDGLVTGEASATVDVVGRNDAPINGNAGADVFLEDSGLNPIVGLSIVDPDAPGGGVIQVTFQVAGSQGTLDIDTSIGGGVPGGGVFGNGSTTVVITATLSEIQTTFANAGVRFIPNPDFAGNLSLTMFSVDLGLTGIGGQRSDSDQFTITVTRVNDAPAGTDLTVNGLEDTPLILQLVNFGFTDPDDSPDDAFSAVIFDTTVTNGRLQYDLDPGPGENWLTFGGPVAWSAADIAAGRVRFVPDANEFGAPYASVTFRVQDNGGTANAGVDTDPVANTLTFNIAANSAPFVDLLAGAGTNYFDTYVENGTPVPIAFIGSITDADSGLGDLIESLTIRITNPAPGDQLTLFAPLPAGITATQTTIAGDPALVLSGAAGSFDYSTALNLVRFSSDSDDPTPPGLRFITVVANDGDDDSATRTAFITVVATDDPATAVNDQFEVPESAILTGNLFGSNDGAPDFDPDSPLAIAAVNGQPANVGTQITLASGALLTVNADGTFSYDPNGAFLSSTSVDTGASNTSGVDSFLYTLDGGTSAQVTINVLGQRSVEDLLIGSVADNLIVDSVGFDDRIFVQQGGDDQVNAGAGNDGAYFGAAYTGADGVDGGAGNDSVALQGFYDGLVLGPLAGVENLVLLSGGNTAFGDGGFSTYDYDVTTIDSNVAAGAILTVVATDLGAFEDLAFDGSAESDGAFRIFAGRGVSTLIGGAGSDGFLFGQQNNWNAANTIDGNGGVDSLAFRGNYSGGNALVFNAASMVEVEAVVLLSGLTNQFGGTIDPAGFDYDLTLADGNVAAGGQLFVTAAGLGALESVRVDARAETDGSVSIISGAGDDILFGSQGADFIFGGAGNDQLVGGGGADLLQSGSGNDSYVYLLAGDSTAAARDAIIDMAAGKLIDLSAIDANGAAAGDGAFAFIGTAAFTGVAGQLRYAASGADAILEGDVDGDGIADLVILVQNWVPVVTDFNL